jgi:probable O-glycosylation ligase (exosortase A-associated)
MRDVILVALFAVLLPLAFKHPVIGAYLYTWLSLMNPHKLTYGFARSLPFAQIAALVVLFTFFMAKKRQNLPWSHPIVVLLLALLAWMSMTSFFAMAPADAVFDRWFFVMKIQLMLFVTWALIVDGKQLRVLVWVVTLSVAFFGIKGGVWTVMTGGGGRVWGPPGGMLQGNNELAVGLVMLMPMMYFLRLTESRAWVRHLLLFFMISCAFSILGSQSRGALLALVSMALFLGLKGKYPVRTSLGIVALLMVALAFMPDTWSDRMDTIKTYQQDGSAMSRIWTWQTLFNAAVDRPFVGAGFVADNTAVFSRYAPQGGQWEVFAGAVYVAHSIWFQVMGEHGFVGFGLFIGIGVATWLSAGGVARRAKALADKPGEGADLALWLPVLMRMVQVSLIGYAIGGSFLSIAYLDLPYYICGFVVIGYAIVRRVEAGLPVPGTPPNFAAPAPLTATPRGPSLASTGLKSQVLPPAGKVPR